MDAKRSIAVRLVASFALAAAAAIVLALLSYRATVRSLASSRSVTQTQEVISTLEETLGLVESAETSQRAYVITGQTGYVRDSLADRPKIEENLAALRARFADDPTKTRAVLELRAAVKRKLSDTDHFLRLHRSVRFEAARDQLAAGRRKTSMDRVRSVIAERRIGARHVRKAV